jgi:hypothetical protein
MIYDFKTYARKSIRLFVVRSEFFRKQLLYVLLNFKDVEVASSKDSSSSTLLFFSHSLSQEILGSIVGITPVIATKDKSLTARALQHLAGGVVLSSVRCVHCLSTHC